MSRGTGEVENREPLLLQMRQDRRLGHEWDDWDGLPLPNGGVYSAGPGLFFAAATGAAFLCAALLGAILWLVRPRLNSLHEAAPAIAGALLVLTLVAWFVWLALIGASFVFRRTLLPARLADRGLLPRVVKPLERLGLLFGISRDRLGNSALLIFNRLSAARVPSNSAEDLLVLLPRCLSKDAMQTAMQISAKHGVSAFVASRGRYARQMISQRRPRGVVAVACERDLVSGIRDVAGRLPVLGSTLGMPEGPCRNTEFDAAAFERQLLAMIGTRDDVQSDGGRAEAAGEGTTRSGTGELPAGDSGQAGRALPVAGIEAQPAQYPTTSSR